MAMNREFEAHIRYNKDNPRAIEILGAMQTLFNAARDTGVLLEIPETHPALVPDNEGVTSIPLPDMEKSLRFALQNLNNPTRLLRSSLLYIQEVRGKIPDIDQALPLDQVQSLRQLLVSAIETLKPNTGEIDKHAARKQEVYEVIYNTAVLGKTNERVMGELYISPVTFYRRQKIAIQGILESLCRPEMNCLNYGVTN